MGLTRLPTQTFFATRSLPNIIFHSLLNRICSNLPASALIATFGPASSAPSCWGAKPRLDDPIRQNARKTQKLALNELRYLRRDFDRAGSLTSILNHGPDDAGLSTQWEELPASNKIALVDRLVTTDHSLRAAWAALKPVVNTSDPAVAGACRDIEAGLTNNHASASTMAETEFFNYQHGRSDVTAEKFFDAVELTERVLLDLDIVDLLAIMRVNNRMHDIIAGSRKLQKHLHLAVDHDVVVRLLDFHPRRGLNQKNNRANLQNLEIKIWESFWKWVLFAVD